MKTKYILPEPFRTNWIAALRSGKYKQGSSSLAYQIDGETRFDALGVACKSLGIADEVLFGPNGSIKSLIQNKPELIDSHPDLKVFMPEKFNYFFEGTVVRMNDDQLVGFPGIAEWIEQNSVSESEAAVIAAS